jgi:hypothetical protein
MLLAVTTHFQIQRFSIEQYAANTNLFAVNGLLALFALTASRKKQGEQNRK